MDVASLPCHTFSLQADEWGWMYYEDIERKRSVKYNGKKVEEVWPRLSTVWLCVKGGEYK
jgi:hypothetical protein